MSGWEPVLLRISEGLSPDNLEAMKFLCRNDIGKKRLETIKSGIQLFQCLSEMNKVGARDTAFLRALLEDIQRPDLVDLLEKFDRCGPPGSGELPDAKEQEKLNIATEVIVDNMGRDWRMFGRKLGISDARLDHVREKHPFNLKEQVVELLREWRAMRKAEARVEALIEALRACRLNLTADLVEKEVSERNVTQ
ncbi:FAS-associated death domain protein [Scleropages formosus]|uniref:Fas associated via death domain n=1 Tax=Scleropages formosus TaxID=113540 RepID=A0A8C9T6G5_SCLFO|nr:FAS-associated death domain protein [Scleropages formosus]